MKQLCIFLYALTLTHAAATDNTKPQTGATFCTGPYGTGTCTFMSNYNGLIQKCQTIAEPGKGSITTYPGAFCNFYEDSACLSSNTMGTDGGTKGDWWADITVDGKGKKLKWGSFYCAAFKP